MVQRLTRRTLLAASLGAAGAGLAWKYWPGGSGGADHPPRLTTYEDLAGCHFTPTHDAPLAAVRTRLISIPDFPGRWAVWGATGRDHRGHIWFGVSAQSMPNASAH